ncbi:MAG TPA: hypothetical protein VK639_13965, partial [Terriglobales bacterium]|nr:hypothetical protein [Terriglobales bacterium]
WKTAPLIIPLALLIGSSSIAQAADNSRLFPGPARPGGLAYPAGLADGYLTVYLTADEFNNAWYFPQNLFAIYLIDGRLFKNVTSQHLADDEIPEVVTLPVGSYIIVARSEKDGYIRLPVVIKAGQRTVLDLDLRQKGTVRRIAQN